MPQVHLIAGEVKASARVTGRRSIKVQTRASQVNLQLLGGGLAATLQSKHDTSTRMWQVVPGPARVQASYIYYIIYILYSMAKGNQGSTESYAIERVADTKRLL